LVRWAFQLSSIQKLITKPLAVAARLDDADFLAQIEAVDRFTDNMIAYPGRTFGQLYHRFVKGNALVHGGFEIDGRVIELAAITAPVLVFAGNTDGIAPVNAVKAVVPMLSGSREVRFEIVPGGHLGMLTGRAARGTTWRAMDDWVDEWSSTETATPSAKSAAARTAKKTTRKAAPKKTSVEKAASKKAAPKKTASKKTARARAAADPDSIGVNPTRRYGSAGSRGLARLSKETR
jgi:polyhydroxyalkanoate synthase